jgi:hypothetical protein
MQKKECEKVFWSPLKRNLARRKAKNFLFLEGETCFVSFFKNGLEDKCLIILRIISRLDFDLVLEDGAGNPLIDLKAGAISSSRIVFLSEINWKFLVIKKSF